MPTCWLFSLWTEMWKRAHTYFWAYIVRVSKYIQDQTFTVNTFLFFLFFQFFFIRCLSYQRNSLHLFLKLLQFALVHLDTNIQGREHDSCSSAATTSELSRFPSPHFTLNNTVLRFYTIFTLEFINTSEGVITEFKTCIEDFSYRPRWCIIHTTGCINNVILKWDCTHRNGVIKWTNKFCNVSP